MAFKVFKEPCWCCGCPRALFFNGQTQVETCLGRLSKYYPERHTDPCKYFLPKDPSIIHWCSANYRTDGNCKGECKDSQREPRFRKLESYEYEEMDT